MHLMVFDMQFTGNTTASDWNSKRSSPTLRVSRLFCHFPGDAMSCGCSCGDVGPFIVIGLGQTG